MFWAARATATPPMPRPATMAVTSMPRLASPTRTAAVQIRQSAQETEGRQGGDTGRVGLLAAFGGSADDKNPRPRLPTAPLAPQGQRSDNPAAAACGKLRFNEPAYNAASDKNHVFVSLEQAGHNAANQSPTRVLARRFMCQSQQRADQTKRQEADDWPQPAATSHCNRLLPSTSVAIRERGRRASLILCTFYLPVLSRPVSGDFHIFAEVVFAGHRVGQTSSGVPWQMTLPASITIARSVMCSVSRTWWSVIRIAIPSSRSRRMIFWMLAIVTGSMPVNGSSRRMIFGFETRQRAISSRRRSPPESEMANERRSLTMSNCSSSSLQRRARLAVEAQQFHDAQAGSSRP